MDRGSGKNRRCCKGEVRVIERKGGVILREQLITCENAFRTALVRLLIKTGGHEEPHLPELPRRALKNVCL